jgi:DNA replication protein DnaC
MEMSDETSLLTAYFCSATNAAHAAFTGLFSLRRVQALLDRLTHHIHILEMNGDSYRLKESKQIRKAAPRASATASQ